MTNKMRKIFIVISLIAISLVAHTAPETQSNGNDLFSKFNWKGPGVYKLEESHSTLSLPPEHIALIGKKDMVGLGALLEDLEDDQCEAFVHSPQGSVWFESITEGYVPLDDWSSLDADKVLKNITETTNEANAERKKYGFDEIYVVGWAQRPTLDRQKNTVFWAIEAQVKERRIVNSVALRLGRYGYEKMTWATSKDNYVPFKGELDLMLRGHSFDRGYRYEDHAKGDKVATYGITALVAATLGGKAAKAGGFLLLLKKFSGALVLLFKKAGAFIVVATGALVGRVRSWFRGEENNQEQAAD